MRRIFMLAGVAVVGLALGGAARAQEQQQQPTYTIPEYNAYQTCVQEQNAQQKIKCLEDFEAKFPESTLLPYAYQLALQTHNQAQDYAQVIPAADKVLGLGDKIDTQTRLGAIYLRTIAFNVTFAERDPQANAKAARARELAAEGVRILEALPKPDNVTQQQFDEQRKSLFALFHATAGYASLHVKDYNRAIEALRAGLRYNPSDALSYFRLGLAYLTEQPPQHMDGFWALARSIALKGPQEAQIRAYLRSQMLRYQLTTCDHLLDAQMNELIALAGTTAERPPNYQIPSSAELDQVRQDAENFLSDLREGGEKGQMRFLATCGLEFPEVAGKIIEVAEGNESVILHMFTGTDAEVVEAAETSNAEVKVVDQPEASRLEKDMYARFSATLAGYQHEPFLLKWDKAKVNPEDIPEPRRGRRPRKRPGR